MTRRQPEKAEQGAIVRLLSMLGRVWVLGTRRRRGSRCPACGAFVPEDQATRQSPGLPDVIAFLEGAGSGAAPTLLFDEVKAADGRPSPDQKDFAQCCRAANVPHVMGNLDATIAWLIEHEYLRRDQVPYYRLPREEPPRRSCGGR